MASRSILTPFSRTLCICRYVRTFAFVRVRVRVRVRVLVLVIRTYTHVFVFACISSCVDARKASSTKKSCRSFLANLPASCSRRKGKATIEWV